MEFDLLGRKEGLRAYRWFSLMSTGLGITAIDADNA